MPSKRLIRFCRTLVVQILVENIGALVSDRPQAEKSPGNADLRQLAKELSDKIQDMDDLLSGRNRSSSMIEVNRKRYAQYESSPSLQD